MRTSSEVTRYILPAYKTFIDRFVAAGSEPSIPQDLLGVKAAYSVHRSRRCALSYGTIETYFMEGLGIDKAGQQRLRERFLTTE